MRRRTFLGSDGGRAPSARRLPLQGPVKHPCDSGWWAWFTATRADFSAGTATRTRSTSSASAEPDQEVAAGYGKRWQARPGQGVFQSTVRPHARPGEARGRRRSSPTPLTICAVVQGLRGTRHLPVMMEKPLAISVEQARAIDQTGDRSRRYPRPGQLRDNLVSVEPRRGSNWFRTRALGPIRKVVIHDGHRGPKGNRLRPRVSRLADRPRSRTARGLCSTSGATGPT